MAASSAQLCDDPVNASGATERQLTFTTQHINCAVDRLSGTEFRPFRRYASGPDTSIMIITPPVAPYTRGLLVGGFGSEGYHRVQSRDESGWLRRCSAYMTSPIIVSCCSRPLPELGTVALAAIGLAGLINARRTAKNRLIPFGLRVKNFAIVEAVAKFSF